MKTIRVKPVKGKKVINPLKNKLIVKELEVPLNAFFSRRIKCGDLEEVKVQKNTIEKKQKEVNKNDK